MFQRFLFNRRAFLKGSLVGAFLLFSGPAFSKTAEMNELPDGTLSLFNTHTKERLEVTYRDRQGNYDPESLKALNHLLRCHYTQREEKIDLRVIEFVNLLDKKLGGNHDIHILSGYRSPEYNEFLIREGRGAARHSLHLQGKAIDLRIPQVGLDILRKTALSLEYGGVGYYPESGFIHLDSGNVRSW